MIFFFFSSRRRHTRCSRDWSSDVCSSDLRGPHIPSTKRIQAFKLMNVAGAYWKGQEGNPQLQRIYAVAFFTQKELDAHLHRIEEAKRRDHRKLGTEQIGRAHV